ncbi:MAG: glycosyltransferase family 39 protein [Anaerolineales bacterium]|jgi:4-amino-4-deoxy-L-arabinose transferase-like glycosyltransferase|nr:glycosyltransferase family 39 protein [Anaerolineales bacterium]
MHIIKTTNFRFLAENKRLKRGLLTLGLLLIAFAQIYFETHNSFRAHITRAAIWNAVNKLEIVNYDNVWRAFPLLLCGIALWFWLGSLHWKNPPFILQQTNSIRIITTQKTIQTAIIGLLYFILLVRLAKQNNTYFEPIIWIIILTWATYIIWDKDRKTTDLNLNITSLDLSLISILLFFGITIGSFALTDLPMQIIPDEYMFWNVSRAISTGEYKASLFEVGVFTFPMSTSIFQSWVMQVFGINLWGWRFSSVLAGVVTIIPLYLLVRDWFNQKTAFIAGVLMLANPYFLSFIRLGYNNSQSLFPTTLAIYLWGKGIQKNSSFYLWAGGVAAGLGYYSYPAAWIGAIAIGISLLFLGAQKQISRKHLFSLITIFATSFILVGLPRIIFTIFGNKSEALILKILQVSFINTFYAKNYYFDTDLTSVYPLIHNGIIEPVFFHPQIYGELLTRGLIRTLLSFVNPYIVTEHNIISSLTGVITPVFFVIGLMLALKNGKNYYINLLLLWFFGGAFFLSITNAFPPRHTHLVSVIPVVAIFSAIGLVSTIDQVALPDYIKQRIFISNLLLYVVLTIVVLFSLYAFFVKLPKTFPSSLEDYAAWVVQKKTIPATIIYAGEIKDIDRIQALISIKMVEETYLHIDPGTLQQVAKNFSKTPSLIVYEGDNTTILDDMQKEGYTNYFFYQGSNSGYFFTNTTIDLSPDIDFHTELMIFFKSPALYLLGTLLIGVFGIQIIKQKQHS